VRALVGLKTRELEELASEMGLEPYRGRQLAHWMYSKRATSFSDMTDLRKDVREKLLRELEVNPLTVRHVREHRDGTAKYLFRLTDGECIEGVWLPHRNWETVCVSTQVGCPVGCAFCASGRDFVRNLEAGEIIGQVLLARREESTHVVFMGIGEPLLNQEAVLRSLEVLNSEVGIGARNVTVSTVGIVDGIVRLADLGKEVNLGISLHAPDDQLRQGLIETDLPAVKDIMTAAGYFFRKTGRRISFEYVLLSDVNDHLNHAAALAGLLTSRDFQFHVNLMQYNETHSPFRRSPATRVREFAERLREEGITVTVRKEMGGGIRAACGQLRRRRSGEKRGERESVTQPRPSRTSHAP